MGKIDVITYKYVININYYMPFFISHPLSVLGHDINPRADNHNPYTNPNQLMTYLNMYMYE